MIVREIGAQVARADRHNGHAVAHLNVVRAAAEFTERDGAVVAAQAKLGRAGRLADGGFSSAAFVELIGGGGEGVVPERIFAGAAMGRVAEHANFGFGDGANVAGTGGGKVMFGVEDGVGAEGGKAPSAKHRYPEKL